ncbi:modulator of macroautophagy TMEM150B isoform X2 [Protopterus annectens]|uniref:modulator of macroautophagy TMEM150B isoform X2 n=1 Tax=Protopterus annectens TaxID=7888 RepID=UPI001CF9541E|nr:modulator of macroautophagy TMEM150B isoform X2 [Protopterus annectens]
MWNLNNLGQYCSMSKWAFLPIILTSGAIIGLWSVYGISIANASVNATAKFPYISACGSYPPQSCIFSQILNLGAFLMVWVILIRYQQVKESDGHCVLNTIALIAGVLCALGMSIVGNFQQVHVRVVHLIGAFLAFVIGVIYFWLQTVLMFKVKPQHGGCYLKLIRIVLCIICTVLIITMAVLHNIRLKSMAAKCEWTAAMGLMLLFGLFAVEFRHIEGHSYKIKNKKRTNQPTEKQASTMNDGIGLPC